MAKKRIRRNTVMIGEDITKHVITLHVPGQTWKLFDDLLDRNNIKTRSEAFRRLIIKAIKEDAI